MFTKECKLKKYCCFYVSDYHLEMILLPYIKNKINNSKIIIYTEKNLSESIEVLLNKTNFTLEEKDKILGLNWSGKKIEDISDFDEQKNIIVINGNSNYISKIDRQIENKKNACIIHCYDIEKNDFDITKIEQKYKGILNTQNMIK